MSLVKTIFILLCISDFDTSFSMLTNVNETTTGQIREDSKRFKEIKVGIIGAGIAGLYAALILQSINVSYEVLEAKERPGGRIYTYNFTPYNGQSKCQKEAYFDVGAMRYPSSWLFDRQFGPKPHSLVNYLNKRLKPWQRVKVLPYLYSSDNNIYYFNKRRVFYGQVKSQREDLFEFGRKKGGNIPDEFAGQSVSTLSEKIAKPFVQLFEKDYGQGMTYLHSYDHQSYRQYALRSFPVQVVDYVDQYGYGTGISRGGLTSVIRGELPASLKDVQWITVDGGSSKLIEAMVSVLNRDGVLFGREVKAIIPQKDKTLSILTRSFTRHNYDHVILTPTLSAIRKIDLSKCHLSFDKQKAIEVFHYLHTVKVGLLFTKRWWQDWKIMKGKPIFGGESKTDLPINTVVFPSNGLNCTEYPAALIASYTVEDGAFRMAGLSDIEIEKLTLSNLSEMFNLDVGQFYTGRRYIYRWQSDPHTLGSVLFLDAGHLKTYLNNTLSAEANGRLHFGGDASGLFHSWSHDSMTNAYRTVLQILKSEPRMAKKYKLAKQFWGEVEQKWNWF